MRTAIFIALATVTIIAPLRGAQDTKKTDDRPLLTIEGCLDGNWLHVKKVAGPASYAERYQLRGTKSMLKEMVSKYKTHLVEITGLVTDPTPNTTHKGKTIQVGTKTRITTTAKDVPQVPDAATQPLLEVVSFRDLAEHCNK